MTGEGLYGDDGLLEELLLTFLLEEQAQTGLIPHAEDDAEHDTSNPISYTQHQIEIESLIIPELVEMHTKMIKKTETVK